MGEPLQKFANILMSIVNAIDHTTPNSIIHSATYFALLNYTLWCQWSNLVIIPDVTTLLINLTMASHRCDVLVIRVSDKKGWVSLFQL